MGNELFFGDKVRIISGFYKDCEGILVDHYNNDDTYQVKGIKLISECLYQEFAPYIEKENLVKI